MKDEALVAEMRRLVLGEHWNVGTVARRLGVHHSVVRRAVYGDALQQHRAGTPSALEPYKPYIVERLTKYPELTAARLILELRDRGYQQGVAILRRFVAQVRGTRPRKAYLRIEVEPGEQAQVDWGSFGHFRVGSTQRPLSVFVMVLSWSRALYLDFSLDQKMETFISMHRQAMIVSKEARVRLDSNTYSVPPSLVGKSVFLRADDKTVRIIFQGNEVAQHKRCWDRRRAIEDPGHLAALIERRRNARIPKRKAHIAELSDACRIYLQEVARRRINLQNEVNKLDRLIARYGEADVIAAITDALTARTFGANYVRALADQRRFARGLGEPPEPIVTGNATADTLVVEPHNLETYDALFKTKNSDPETQTTTDTGTDDNSGHD